MPEASAEIWWWVRVEHTMNFLNANVESVAFVDKTHYINIIWWHLIISNIPVFWTSLCCNLYNNSFSLKLIVKFIAYQIIPVTFTSIFTWKDADNTATRNNTAVYIQKLSIFYKSCLSFLFYHMINRVWRRLSSICAYTSFRSIVHILCLCLDIFCNCLKKV